MDRDGRITSLRSLPADWTNLTFASDGRRLAMDIADGASIDVWVYEWARDALSRLTFDGANTRPVWTPDGRRIVFGSMRGDKQVYNLYRQAADAVGEVHASGSRRQVADFDRWRQLRASGREREQSCCMPRRTNGS
jgi:Tol biopolymer transport system component